MSAKPGPLSDWTEERVAKLRELRAKGISFRQIAIQLGDISKSACITKAIREGLVSRRAPMPPRPKPFKRHNDMIMTAPRPPAITPKNEPAPIGPLRDLPARGCKFIRGSVDDSDWRCCGAPPAKPGGSWCSYHHKIIYPYAAKKTA